MYAQNSKLIRLYTWSSGVSVTPQQGCESTCDGYLGKAEGQGGEEHTGTALIGAHHVVSKRTAQRSSVEDKVQAPSAVRPVRPQQPPLVQVSLRLAEPLSGPRVQGRCSSLVCIFPRPCEQCLITFPFKNLPLLRPNLYVRLLHCELRVLNKKLRLRLLFLTGTFFS